MNYATGTVSVGINILVCLCVVNNKDSSGEQVTVH
jgi:hypothetical protein